MDFYDELKAFSGKLEDLRVCLDNEQATINSLITPVFRLLGYKLEDPNFKPQYLTAIGDKPTGERVDFAIIIGGKPTILLEAKHHDQNLKNHVEQLCKYFSNMPTGYDRFAILANGIEYWFFTDLKDANKMDLRPYYKFDLRNFARKDAYELERFAKDKFDATAARAAARELREISELKGFFSAMYDNPSDSLLKFLLQANGVSTKITKSAMDDFKQVVIKAFNEFLSTLGKPGLDSSVDTPKVKEDSIKRLGVRDKEGLYAKGFEIVCDILSNVVDVNRIGHEWWDGDTNPLKLSIYLNKHDTSMYRLYFDGTPLKISISRREKGKSPYCHKFGTVNDIYKYRDLIVDVCNARLGS